MQTLKRFLPVLLVAFLALLFTVGMAMRVKEFPPLIGDALENLQLAHSLASRGEFAIGDDPSMWREPLPPLVLAAWMQLGGIGGGETVEHVNKGTDLAWLKLSSVLLLSLCGVLVAYLGWSVIGQRMWGVIAALCFYAYFSLTPDALYADTLLSEPLTMVLLSAFSLCVVHLIRRWSWQAATVTGALLGGAVLTKALFLYIAPFTALALTALVYWRFRSLQSTLLVAVIVGALPLLIAFPWMLRNHWEFQTFSLTTRGGMVLYYRSLLNQTSSEEYRGLFYVFTPPQMRAPIGRLLGIDSTDLTTGPLARISLARPDPAVARAIAEGRPEEITALRYKLNAEMKKRSKQVLESNLQKAVIVADRSLRAEAIQNIQSHPGAHLATTLPILWRGMWIGRPYWAMPIVFWSIFVSCAVAFRRRHYEIVAMTFLPCTMVSIYALSSHFIPRYSLSVLPVMLVSTLYLAHLTLGWFVRRYASHWVQGRRVGGVQLFRASEGP